MLSRLTSSLVVAAAAMPAAAAAQEQDLQQWTLLAAQGKVSGKGACIV